jgi:hypothetical protein
MNQIIKNSFAITFDIEWAPDEILLDIFNLLSGYSVAGVFEISCVEEPQALANNPNSMKYLDCN